MESALMIVPPKRSASSRPAPDFPLAVGPAIRMALIGTGEALGSGDRHRDEAEPALRVGDQQQHRFPPRFLYRGDPRHDLLWVAHPLLGDLDDDIARLHVLLGRGAVGLDFRDHHALDAFANAE